jgi:FtsP/CotA-like multicopper oxidase with cupredoxin domain
MKKTSPVSPRPYAQSTATIDVSPTGIDRRSFLRRIAGSSAALTAAGLGLPALARAAKPGTTTVRYSLRIPPLVSANLGRLALSLASAPGSVDLGGGKLSAALTYSVPGYSSLVPGATLRASSGDTVDITFTNGLAEETTTHWHGMIVHPEADGGPLFPVAPGGVYDYVFTIAQRAALNWYHPHAHLLTGKQVNLGLAGAFIVNDLEEAALNLPSGPHEIPLIIRDANLDKAGNLIYNPTTSGFSGKVPLVNATRNPKLDVNAGWYRFRMLNGANARLFRLALGNGAPFVLIGNDGGLLEAPVTIGEIEFGPGERLDLLVDFSGLARNATVMLRDLNAGWDLLQFVGTGSPGADYSVPTTLSSITRLQGPTAPTRTFTFDGMSRINGLVYDPVRIDFQVPFMVTERWRFSTGGNAPHPIHVHGASFQVVSRTGGRNRLFPWESGWKDTVLLQDQETVDVLIGFERSKGLYVMHCHKLEHEDMGMMTNFEVV